MATTPPPGPMPAVKERRFQLLLFCLCALLTFAACPQLFLEPRFWAEEGQLYFAHAFSHSFADNLLTGFQGYYSLVPNFATGLATLFPLELAPAITSCLAFAVQMAVLAVVIFGTSDFWDNQTKKTLVAVGIVLVSPPESWLNTIHSAFWLSLGTLFILLQPGIATSGARKGFSRVMLLLGGLTGVVSTFMTPVFLLKARCTRLREDFIHTGILAVCGVIQVAVCVKTCLFRSTVMASRFNADGFDLSNSILHVFVDPFFSSTASVAGLDRWFRDIDIGLTGTLGIVPVNDTPLMFMLLAVMVSVTGRACCHYRDKPAMTHLALSFLLVTVLTTLSALNMGAAPRYAFLPSVMILVLLVRYATDRAPVPKFGRGVALAVVVAIFALNVAGYPRNRQKYVRTEWPRWPEEVAAWRQQQSRPLKIWPPPWMVTLEKPSRENAH